MHSPLLVSTSCLYATVVVHAFYADAWAYHHLFLCVTVLSVMYHATGNACVRGVDKIVAYYAFCFMFLEGFNVESPRDLWLFFFTPAVLVLWVSELYSCPRRARDTHAVLHVVSVVGMHCFLSVRYPMETSKVWGWLDRFE